MKTFLLFLIIINLHEQKLHLYYNHHEIFVTQVSTGKKSMPTPIGEYKIGEKILLQKDIAYHMKLPYFMRLSSDPPFGIHFANDPGHPASHGCIRIGKMKIAKWIFDTVPEGARVIIQP